EDGKWKMENGKWKMENGKWKMENGKWKMENGKWKMENGKWKMENGKWKMENGKWDTGHGKEKMRQLGGRASVNSKTQTVRLKFTWHTALHPTGQGTRPWDGKVVCQVNSSLTVCAMSHN
ncbi:hypothetical protein DFH29DRAFT_816856, partial [Suillus ampliporus]